MNTPWVPAFLALVLLSAISSAQAAQLEQYPAIDPGLIPASGSGSMKVLSAPPQTPPPARAQRNQTPSQPQAQPLVQPRSQLRAQPAAAAPEPAVQKKTVASSKGAFDPVASDQVESIARRIRLVEAILRKHARAYDYRIHSARELQAILSSLDASTQPAHEETVPITEGESSDSEEI